MYMYSISSTHARCIRIQYMVLMLGSHPIISRSPSLAAASLRAIVMYRSRSVPVWLECVAGCCSVLQCVIVCYNAMLCVAVSCIVIALDGDAPLLRCSVLQCITVCCSMSQCEASLWHVIVIYRSRSVPV